MQPLLKTSERRKLVPCAACFITVSTIKTVTPASYTAKSLFWKILEISPCDSRFCGLASRYPSSNLNKINILANGREKHSRSHGDQNVAKSLFWKILPASPFGSRFCGSECLCRPGKFNEINILASGLEKNLNGRRANRIERGSDQ